MRYRSAAKLSVADARPVVDQAIAGKIDEGAACPFKDEIGSSKVPIMAVALDQRSFQATIRHHGEPIGKRRHMLDPLDGLAEARLEARQHLLGSRKPLDGVFAGIG